MASLSGFSEGTTRIGVVSFGNDGIVHIHLSDYSNLDEFFRAVDKIRFRDQWTNTASGLRVTRTELFTTANGDRYGVPNMAVILTDGECNKERSRLIYEARSARQNNKIALFGIGLGPEANLNELRDITGDNSYVIPLARFEEIRSTSIASTVLGTLRGRMV